MIADRESGRRTGPMYMGQGYRAGCLALFLAAVVFVVPALAQTQSMQPVFDRLERLERDIRTLNQQIARPGSVPPAAASPGPGAAAPVRAPEVASGDAYVRIDGRLAALEDELRGLTGRNEEIVHRLAQMESTLEKMSSDIDFRLGALEKSTARADPQTAEAPAAPPSPRTGAAPSQPPRTGGDAPLAGASPPGVLGTIPQNRLDAQTRAAPPPPAAAAPAAQPAARPAALPPGTPREKYDYAQQLLLSGKHAEAEQALTAFVTAHPNDPLTSSALFWRGESFSMRKDHKQAAVEYLNVYQKYPKGNKAPEALLKLGSSLGELNDKKNACATFTKLRSEYNDAPANIQRLADQERKKYGCT